MRDFWNFLKEFVDAIFHPYNYDVLASDLPHNQETGPLNVNVTGYTPRTATQTVQVPQTTSRDFLTLLATYIRDFEGKPGDLNYRNNNPGNCRCSRVGYASMYGNVKCVNNFAVFPTYEQGFTYLKNLLHERIEQHPNWGLLDLMNVYAPTGDNNNPEKYAGYLGSRLGIDIHYPLSKCL